MASEKPRRNVDGDRSGNKRPRLTENAKTALLTAVSTLLFVVLVIGIYVKAGSDAYKKHCSFDSYTLQAMAWRRGETKLDKNYPHLELAIINRPWLETHDKNDYMAYRETFGDINAPIQHVEGNEYYVSFPPVPSVPMFVMSFFTGRETPDNLFSILYAAGSFALAVLICRRSGYGCVLSLAGGIFSGVASGALFLCANKYAGGPWFAAQNLAILFTFAAFYSVLGKRRAGTYLSFAFLALAVGCRPFQILYFIPLAYIAAKKEDFRVVRTLPYYVAPAVIGGSYMIYNYVRFGDPLEFGHNFLPEFMRVPDGQFSTAYIKGNAKAFFRIFPSYSDGKLEFTRYGFAFWVSNVIFVLAAVALILYAIYVFRERRARRFPFFRGAVFTEAALFALAGAVHVFLLLLHRTAGGWQFGMRYTVDIIPAMLMICVYCCRPFFAKEIADKSGPAPVFRGALAALAVQLLVFGAWINIYGSYMMFS